MTHDPPPTPRPTGSGEVEGGAAVGAPPYEGAWPCTGLEGTGLGPHWTESPPAWAARQLGSGDLLEGPAPAEVRTFLCSQLCRALVRPAEEDGDPLRQVPLSRGPLGVLQGEWDRTRTARHLTLASTVCRVRRAGPEHVCARVCACGWALRRVETCVCARTSVCTCVCVHAPVCTGACVHTGMRAASLAHRLPRFAPRGAGTIPVTARTARAACAPPCPPTPAPAPPRASCCGAGGSKSAVSAGPAGRPVSPWREGQPAA